MAGINTNLKQLRLAKKMTQEDVAQKIGLTRQAISSYEAGRTQPGVDLLMRFAEIYEVELEEILYGQKKEQKERKRIVIAVCVITVIWLICEIGSVGTIALRNVLYPWDTITAAAGGEYTEAVEKFFDYSELAGGLAKCATQVMSIGCYVLCVLDWMLEKSVRIQKKLLYIVAVSVTSAILITIVEALFLPEYQRNFFDVLIWDTDWLNMLSILGVNLIGLGIKKIIKKKNKV